MPGKIDLNKAPTRIGSGYPAPFDKPCKERMRWKVGDAAGLTQFGVNILRLKPGTWSSQRHWHTHEDEFVFVIEGEVVLVTNEGEEVLRAGDCAGFPAGAENGHHLQNRSQSDVLLLEMGSRNLVDDEAFYPDIDLHCRKGDSAFVHKDGQPY